MTQAQSATLTVSNQTKPTASTEELIKSEQNVWFSSGYPYRSCPSAQWVYEAEKRTIQTDGFNDVYCTAGILALAGNVVVFPHNSNDKDELTSFSSCNHAKLHKPTRQISHWLDKPTR